MRLLFILFICSISTIASSQEIKSDKTFGDYIYYKDGVKLTFNDMVKLTEPYPEAHSLMRSARTNEVFSTIFSIAGGALIGWPIGSALGGGSPNWWLAAYGAGGVGISYAFSAISNNKAHDAIEIYNNEIESSSSYQPSFHLNFNSNGIGLSFQF